MQYLTPSSTSFNSSHNIGQIEGDISQLIKALKLLINGISFQNFQEEEIFQASYFF